MVNVAKKKLDEVDILKYLGAVVIEKGSKLEELSRVA